MAGETSEETRKPKKKENGLGENRKSLREKGKMWKEKLSETVWLVLTVSVFLATGPQAPVRRKKDYVSEVINIHFPYYSLHFLFQDCIYLFVRDRERERQTPRQREKQAPLGEPDAGLQDHCHPEPKAEAPPLSHPGVPPFHFQVNFCSY